MLNVNLVFFIFIRENILGYKFTILQIKGAIINIFFGIKSNNDYAYRISSQSVWLNSLNISDTIIVRFIP